MTASKHFKQLVRARMAAAGETYTTARNHVRAVQTDITLVDPVVTQVHGRHGQAVAFTPDGTRLLSGGQDARIAVLDAASGEVEGELVGHDKVVNAVAITPDGNTVVSVSSDRTVRTWDLATGRQLAVLDGHRDAIVALDLSPDGSQALTGGYDGRLRRWDLQRGECVQEVRSGLKRIAAIAYTSDGEHTLESGQGPLVVVRDVSGEVVAELDTGAPAVAGLAISPDGAMAATAGYDGTLGLWSYEDATSIRELAVGDRVNAVAFSRGGQLLAAAVRGLVAVWSHEDDTPIATSELPIEGVYALAFSPDTRRLAQTGADGKVRVWTL